MEKGKASQVAKASRSMTTTTTKEIPTYSQKDAYLWVCCAERHFIANPTMTDRQKLRAAIAVLEEPASNWYQDWKKYSATPINWSSFKEAFLNRFQPEAIRYPCLPLLNLHQTGTVAEYCDLFETLTSSEPLRQVNLSDEILMSIFFNGLREDLRVEQRLREANSLSDLMDTANLIEEEKTAEAESKLTPNPFLEFWGEVAGRKVIILVSAGASVSRIEKRLVVELGLPVFEPEEEFYDMRYKPPVKSEGVCKDLKIKMKKNLEVTGDFFVFENLGGKEEIELGFDWIRSLDEVKMVRENGLTLKFNVDDEAVTLKGDPSLITPPPPPLPPSPPPHNDDDEEVRFSLLSQLKL